MKENNKEIIFYCTNCQYKNITKSISVYKEHFVPSVPLSYDEKKRKIVSKSRRKQFKCPKCGYVIVPRFLQEVVQDHNLGDTKDECENNSSGNKESP